MKNALPLMMTLIAASTLPARDDALDARCTAVLTAGLASHASAFWPAMHAAEALTQAGRGADVTRALTPLLAQISDDQQRCGVARELARAGDLAQTELLWEILQSPSDHGHVHAAESLFKVGWAPGADPAPMRRAFAQETNPRLRMMAAAALARHASDPDALAFLRRRVAEETVPDLLFLFGWGLGQLGGPQDIPVLQARLKDLPDPWPRSFLEHALARLGDPAARQSVLDNLASGDVRIVTYAAETAGAIGLAPARDALIALLEHSDLDTRIRSAQALLLLSQPPQPKP